LAGKKYRNCLLTRQSTNYFRPNDEIIITLHDDYYQNILYPLQDKVLGIIAKLPVDFYLTGGTALSRIYLHHRYSDDLDFFVNDNREFKTQVNKVMKAFNEAGLHFSVAANDESFARVFIVEAENSLKIDFVNDVPFRSGSNVNTPLFEKTDNINNILSNKITALSRYSAKDVVDVVFICNALHFNWENIFKEAAEKDIWVNPVLVADILEKFPPEKLQEIIWINKVPSREWFSEQIHHIISDMIIGSDNTIVKSKS